MTRALLALCLSALALPGAAAGAPQMLATRFAVDPAARIVHVSTLVQDAAGDVLDRAYVTTLQYRCGRRFHPAVTTGSTTASVDLRWHYPVTLRGRRCGLRAVVRRIGGGRGAQSTSVRRRF